MLTSYSFLGWSLNLMEIVWTFPTNARKTSRLLKRKKPCSFSKGNTGRFLSFPSVPTRIIKHPPGTFFVTRVELGGRLHSTDDTDAFSQETVEQRASSMKIAAAASFSSAWVQGSASYSQGNATNTSTTNQNSGLNMNLTWEAKGGDTLLCNKWVFLPSHPLMMDPRLIYFSTQPRCLV